MSLKLPVQLHEEGISTETVVNVSSTVPLIVNDKVSTVSTGTLSGTTVTSPLPLPVGMVRLVVPGVGVAGVLKF